MKNKVSLGLGWIAAVILFQTLYFKFTGAPESVYIFSTLGVEPWGRLFAGFSELVAGGLLILPMTQILGAAMAVGIMLGAIASHVAVIGIVVQDDGGLLFTLACVVLVASLSVVFLQRSQIPIWVARAKKLI